MADRKVHYEAAFEGFLRERGVPYVAVDEAKRALFSEAKLKSFDFVVYSRAGRNLLADVKGRSCRDRERGRGMENWVTEQDVEDLAQWEQVFGSGFSAVFVFAYWIECPMIVEEGMFEFRERWYWLMGVELGEYREKMRRRSPRWRTVCLPSAEFRALARPIGHWL
jgi:hypothetical protein